MARRMSSVSIKSFIVSFPMVFSQNTDLSILDVLMTAFEVDLTTLHLTSGILSGGPPPPAGDHPDLANTYGHLGWVQGLS